MLHSLFPCPVQQIFTDKAMQKVTSFVVSKISGDFLQAPAPYSDTGAAAGDTVSPVDEYPFSRWLLPHVFSLFYEEFYAKKGHQPIFGWHVIDENEEAR